MPNIDSKNYYTIECKVVKIWARLFIIFYLEYPQKGEVVNNKKK